MDTSFHKAFRAGWLLLCAALGAPGARADVSAWASAVTPGGAVSLTSDYIYRGVSQSAGHPAAQADLHLSGDGGTFLGAWASTRDSDLEPGAGYVLELYLGHRFELSAAWNATFSARSHYFLGSTDEPSADYQEISGTLTYLDRWSASLTAIPNAVRYWHYARLSRTPAWVADTSGQWQMGRQFFLTAGVGYYYSSGDGPGIKRSTGYAYGNAGVAFERHRWRLDVGYFLAQDAAQRSFPYPVASERWAATLAWHF